MSFYDANFLFRQAVSIDGSAANAGTIDATIAIPSTWSQFWSNVRSDGADIRVTAADGVTLLTYDLDSWNYSAKTGNIRIDGLAHSTNSAQNSTRIVRVYWGDADASAAASNNIQIASAKTGSICLGRPGTGGYPIIRCASPRLDVDETAAVITKQSTESIRVYWDLSDMLARRDTAYEGSHVLEEIDYVTFAVKDVNGGAQAGLTDLTKIETVDPYYVSTWLQSGTDDNNYLLTLTVYTTEGRILDFRATLKVNDKAAITTTV